MSDSNVIIGVHGLNNKPAPDTLAHGWKASLVEGLEAIGVANPEFEFRMVHWADLLHGAPLPSGPRNPLDTNYDKQPYARTTRDELKAYDDGRWVRFRSGSLDAFGGALDWLKQEYGVNSLADWFLRQVLRDLSFYYSETPIENRDTPATSESARFVLREEVSTAVREAHSAGKRILLIGHSMGSIVGYDALRGIGREDDNEVEVADFVTIGSPLGLPHVMHKIKDERFKLYGEDPQVRTPSIVTERWTNFADRRDAVAVDTHLADDFKPNRSTIKVKDDIVLNNFHTMEDGERDNNHHKSYGYLRTPEVANHVRTFLGL